MVLALLAGVLLIRAARDWRGSPDVAAPLPALLAPNRVGAAALGLLSFVSLYALTRSSLVAAAVPAAAVGLLLLASTIFADRRREKFESQLPDALELLGRALRAGHTTARAFEVVSRSTGEPLATEFRRLADEARFGISPTTSLAGLVRRWGSRDLVILAAAMEIQHELGGDVSRELESLRRVMRDRARVRRQLDVYTAQGRMTGYILVSIPLFLAALLALFAPQHMEVLLEEPMGRAMLLSAAVLQVLGFVSIRRLLRIQV